MAIDRRVVRTRTALYDALVTLIRRRHYDAISVQDVLDEANVGRSTFYAHFKSKDELLERSLERLRALLEHTWQAALSEADDAEAIPYAYTRALFEHVAEFRDVQAGLSGTRGERIVTTALRDNLTRFLGSIAGGEPPRTVPRDLAIGFIAETFIAVITWWREKRPDLSPAEAESLFRQLVDKGVGLPGRPSSPACRGVQ